MRILVVNAGSSSLKLSVVDGSSTLLDESVAAAHGEFDLAAVRDFLSEAGAADAVGHRIVHGGPEFTGPVVIDGGVRARIEALTDLAPLHQPKSLAALDAVTTVLPAVPAVACFDTAFHATIPAAAHTYALPREWRERWPLRRFGFHGLSHAYASRRAAEMVGRSLEELRIVSCHLGAGASVCAVQGGVSVDTTMGFTPLEGLVMATRSGSVDPGLVLWLQEHVGMPAAELASTLEHRSGLLGLAGTSDMRTVLEAAGGGAADARLAVEVYVHRLRAAIGAMVAALGGLDVLLFTGGVGEHAAAIRSKTADGLGWLGAVVDDERNLQASGDSLLSPPDSAVQSLVTRAREDLQIAGEVEAVLGGQ
jgi:acetate kinase